MQSYSLFFARRLFHKINHEIILNLNKKKKHIDRMPYTKEQLEQMQLKRQEKRKVLNNLVYGTASLKVLGTGAPGSPTNLTLVTSHCNYIFNCGEGYQKVSFEHKSRMTKSEHVFITSTTWKNLGGLPGMLLTIQNLGMPPIYLHAPKGTIDIMDSFKTFVIMDTLKVEEFDNEIYKDKVVTVKHVRISKSNVDTNADSNEKKVFKVNEQLLSGTLSYNSVNSKKPCDMDMHRMKRPRLEISSNKVTDAMCYICKLSDQPGKLSLEKCLEKGVQPGPILGKLKSGQDVTLPDGTFIKSSDVCEPPVEGPTFMVVECPTEDHLDSFVNHKMFIEHQVDNVSNQKDIPCYVYHFTPQNVMENTRYREWMKKYGPTTIHIILNESNKCNGQVAVYEQQHLMHLLHPEIFPLLNEEQFKEDTNEKMDSEKESSENSKDSLQIQNVKSLHTVNLMPRLELDTDAKMMYNPQAFIDLFQQTTNFYEHLPKLREKIQDLRSSIKNEEYPRIVMLGTGSSIPNKIRNTSAVLVRIDEDRSILLDCGESTLGQLIKLYGKSKLDKILASIKAVYVSHIHADHHIGLFSVLRARQKVVDDELYLLVPEPLYEWISLYNMRFEPVIKRCVVMTNGFFNAGVSKPDIRSNSTASSLLRNLNLADISTVLVKHCAFAYAIRLTLSNGKTIVYSGDSMPCRTMTRIGSNCDLLIHEATFEDGLEDQARQKCHSTTSQAIKMGQSMNAKFILLTHFSQRYSKLPIVPDTMIESGKVGIAYDFMDISLKELPLLPVIYPVLKIIYSVSYSKTIKHYLVEEMFSKEKL